MFTCEIHSKKQNDLSFAVMLIPISSFPTDDKIDKIVRLPLHALVAAQNDDEGWSFICLSREEKHCIGDAMLEDEWEIGRWFWCNLYEQLRHGEF